MKMAENGVLLRIFIGESDREPGRDRPLFEALVRRAREAHLAGATVLRGPMGFGRHSRVHAAKLLELSTDLPIVIEIVGAEEKINAFLPTVDELVRRGWSRSKRCASSDTCRRTVADSASEENVTGDIGCRYRP
jgi:PII-like signaling protein